MTVMAMARESLWRELRRAPGQCTELRGDSTIDVRARVPECSASNEMRHYSRSRMSLVVVDLGWVE